jgi:UTP--glucose-1-phosphate uridylyltransferase
MTVTTAIIPAAGWGTRMLPASFSVPKELLPVFDRPSIEWVVAEAVAAGIERIVLISGRGKSGLMDHFDRHPHLESILAKSAKDGAVEEIVERAKSCQFIEVRQGDARGLGHAVLCGELGFNQDRVAVLLPDDLYFGSPSALSELITLSDSAPEKGVIGLLEVAPEQSRKYGMVGGVWHDGQMQIDTLVEKPEPENAPSNFAITGRYVLPSELFDLLRNQGSGALGEIQLTDALQTLAANKGMLGMVPSAKRYDAGDAEGLLIASLRCALDHGSDSLRARVQVELQQ